MFADRLEQFIDSQGVAIREFAMGILVSPGSIHSCIKNNTILSGTILQKVAKRYPELNIDWLLTGTGTMLKTESEELEELLKQARQETKEYKDLVEVLKLAVREKYEKK